MSTSQNLSPYGVAGSSSPSPRGDLQSTFSDMWATRPVRIPAKQGSDAKVAGVCEGIAVRYQVDPTLVRVTFAAASIAFGGGVAAYLLAWAVMPRYGKPTMPLGDLVHGPRGPHSERGLAIALVIAFVLFASGGNEIISSTLLSVALLVLAWYLLHQRTPVPPAGLLAAPDAGVTGTDAGVSGPGVPDAAPAPSTAPAADLSAFVPVAGYPFPPGRQTPPDWDPLGAAPDLWHLGDVNAPAPAPAPKKKSRPWVSVAITIAAIGAVVSFVAVTTPDNAAFLRSSEDVPGQAVGIGSIEFAPRSVADIKDEYQVGIGPLLLDLTDIDDLDTLDQPREVEVYSGIGSARVILPKDASINVECGSGIGERTCTDHHTPDAKLTLILHHGIGSLDVEYK